MGSNVQTGADAVAGAGADLRPFRSGAAVVERPDHGLLRFRGPQARWFLDQLLTNRVLDLPPGAGLDALLLTPKGRITALLRLLAPGDEEIIAVLGPRVGQSVAMVGPFFEGRIFATRVTVEDCSDALALVSLLGPTSDEVAGQALARLGAGDGAVPALPAAEEGANVTIETGDGSILVARVIRPVRGLDLVVPRDRLAEVVGALVSTGAERRPAADLDALSVIEGLPRYGVDFDERRLPQEAALERAVHFSKGCYLGQEAVAMAQRGRVKRRLRHLAFEGRAATGPLFFQGREVGEVTSAAEEDGRGWGIATVLTSVEPGSVVEVLQAGAPVGPESRTEAVPAVAAAPEVDAGAEAGGPEGLRAEVRELPGTHEGPKAPSARELRERLTGG